MVINVFNKNAQLYQQKYMDVSMYGDTLDIFCDNIAKDDTHVLDIACGPGNVTKYVLNKKPGLKVLGIDIAPEMLQLARNNNPTAEFKEMDCRDISQLNRKYDGIIIGFCLPYLSKQEATTLITDAAELLQPGAPLYISTMEDSYERSGMVRSSSGDEVYMYYHEADYLQQAIKDSGLTILDLRRQQYTGYDGAPVTDLEIVAVKK